MGMVGRAIAGCVLAVTVGLVGGCGGPVDDRVQQVRPLVDVAAQRMLLADAVAADKRTTGAPIEDLAREKVVLDVATVRGQELGLDPALVRSVVGDQIRASKAVQHGLVQRWAAGAAAVPDRSDSVEIRRTLDVLTDTLLVELSRSGSVRDEPACRETVDLARRGVARDRDLDALHSEALATALMSICRR